jgi:hypothetical protein
MERTWYTNLILMIFAAALFAASLSSCGLTARELQKVDASLNTLLTESKLSLDCKAGIANGFIIAPNSNASVRGTAAALKSVANPESPDYKQCYGQAVWISFLIHGAKDLSDKIIGKLVTLGVMVP